MIKSNMISLKIWIMWVINYSQSWNGGDFGSRCWNLCTSRWEVDMFVAPHVWWKLSNCQGTTSHCQEPNTDENCLLGLLQKYLTLNKSINGFVGDCISYIGISAALTSKWDLGFFFKFDKCWLIIYFIIVLWSRLLKL